MSARATYASLLLASLLASAGVGCDRIAAFKAGDAGDGVRGDTSRDQRPPDDGAVDAPLDNGIDIGGVDAAGVDVGTIDQTLDAGVAESVSPDDATLDIAVDSVDATADSSLDVIAPLPGCGGGTLRVYTFSSTMIICSGGTSLPQDQASKFCGTGWTVCHASQYLALGGAAIGTPYSAWISGCIRNAGAPFAPTDGNCPNASFPMSAEAVSWACQTGSALDYSVSSTVSIQTAPTCARIGANTASTAGFWSWATPAVKLPGAVCCQ
ncbi:MAG: hypothetical protein KC503_34790 [Myxococcales bacterium]|nr:hypothetical protein [Myxococcales bacterium]